MAATEILEYNVAQQAWEPRNHTGLGWHIAAVRDGGAEAHAIYQASSAGAIYQADTGDDDAGEPIPFLALGKRYDCGAVAMAHSLFFRFDGVTADSLDVTVTMGSSGYDCTGR
jgi:hypothetical protein